jgi:hypothetical protein
MPGRKPESGRKRAGGGAREGAGDFFQLVIAYAKQETLEPVLRQLKKLGWGVAGGLLMALSTLFLALGFVRAVQTEFGSGRAGRALFVGLGPFPRPRVAFAPPATGGASFTITRHVFTVRAGVPSPFGTGAHLSGDWSWVPYMGGVLFCLLVAGFCVLKIVKGVSQ